MDAKLLSICPNLQGSCLKPLCTAEVGVDVGVGPDFNSSDGPPDDGFAFLGGPNYTEAFEAVVFGMVTSIKCHDGHTVVTLVTPTTFIAGTAKDRNDLVALFCAQGKALDSRGHLDASSGLWVQWKDGGVHRVLYWTGHSAYNGPGADRAELEIYVHLASEVPVPTQINTVAYACNFQIFQTGCDREYVVRDRRVSVAEARLSSASRWSRAKNKPAAASRSLAAPISLAPAQAGFRTAQPWLRTASGIILKPSFALVLLVV
ncbi:hypothetical protein C8J57DRAFT_1509324 [Mycena rebaudengoi]|nr:hypothetical protein C8J57DRAFT_1509324 [Mycena rebaudengoi]